MNGARIVGTAVVGSALTAASLLALQKVNIDQPPANGRVIRQVVGGGKWQSQLGATDQRDWHVQIEQRDDNSIAGRVIIVGGKLPQAKLQGEVRGGEVYGVLLHDDGQQVGTLTGSVYQNAVSGTYQTADGDSGTWATDTGAAVQEVTADPLAVPAQPVNVLPGATPVQLVTVNEQ